MRTVEVKNVNTNEVVIRSHFWSIEQVKENSLKTLPSGEYLIQGTNSMSCKPRISKKAWESAERFVVGGIKQ